MKRMTVIVAIIQLINWSIDWPLVWQIVFTVFGALLWLMVYAVQTAEPEPQEHHPEFYESSFFHDN